MSPGRSVGKERRRPVEGEKWLGLATSLKPYLIVFVAGACGLIIEIVAARILAPTIGVSLYTWTSIIGVVLAGISAGNYLGGRVADRFPSPTTLGLILLAGGVSSLSVLLLIGVLSAASDALPLLARIIFLTATLFFLPSLILGMVTPVVIKLRLRDLAHAGNVVGKIYALSTTGSIVGTFITGFVLIQWIGSRQTILLVGIVLVLMALAFGNLWRARVPAFSLIVLFVGLGSLGFSKGTLDSGCVQESNYYCIRVSEDIVQGGHSVKVLQLDKLLHSFVSLEDPTFLAHSYQEVLKDIETYIAQRNPSLRVLFIGGGGYTMPRYLEAVYPQSRIEVIEIDPEVTSVAFEYLGLRPDTQILTYNEDARIAVPKLLPGQYDLVVGDAFHDTSIPYHLITREFNEQVRALLKDEGIYAVNVIDKLHTGRFLRAYVNTLQRTFPYVYIARDNARWDDDVIGTYVLVSSLQPLSPTSLGHTDTQTVGGRPATRFMPEDAFKSWLDSPGNILLTDDYAPVDNLMAPISLAAHSLSNTNLSRAKRHYNVGVELESQGKLHEAVAAYDRAVRLDPQFTAAYNNRGAAYASLGQTQRAIQDYGEAIRLAPQYMLAYHNRGTAYISLGQLYQAAEDLNKAIKLDSQFALSYARRALVYTALGKDAQAQEDFYRAIQLGADPAVLREETDRLMKRLQ